LCRGERGSSPDAPDCGSKYDPTGGENGEGSACRGEGDDIVRCLIYGVYVCESAMSFFTGVVAAARW